MVAYVLHSYSGFSTYIATPVCVSSTGVRTSKYIHLLHWPFTSSVQKSLPSAISTANFLSPFRLCSNVPFSVRPTVTTLFEVTAYISSTSNPLCSVLLLSFLYTYHILRDSVIYLFSLCFVCLPLPLLLLWELHDNKILILFTSISYVSIS